jgi:serine/threonine-protein kinase
MTATVEMSAALRARVLAPPPPEEMAVSRRYQVLGQLDRGGMGEIFLARVNGAAGFSKEVVIKRLRRKLAAEPSYVARFLDEARMLASMSHPNVCQIHDLFLEAGQFYLAMEYLHGLPLVALEAVPARMLCGLAVQVCEGLHHVHSLAGVVHRDISPQNLFLTVSGAAKILDFGIARANDSARLTPCNMVRGKVAYMAPEQLRGEDLDARCDLYALGLVLAEAAGGVERVGAALGAVIARATEPDRQRRFASAREMRAAIDRAGAAADGVATPSELAEWLVAEYAGALSARKAQEAEATATVTSGAIVEMAPSTVSLRARSDERPAPVRVIRVAQVDATVIDASPARGGRSRRRRNGLIVAVAAAAVIAIGAGVGAMESEATPAASAAPTPTPTPTPSTSTSTSTTPAPLPDPAVPGMNPPHAGPPKGATAAAGALPARPRTRTHARARASTAPVAVASGTLTIVSQPFAYLEIDGREAGVTPMWRADLEEGHHKVVAVTADGRRKVLDVSVKGETRRRLTW